MFTFEILKKMLFAPLFFSFAEDGADGDFGGSGEEGAPSSGVKNDVTPETHFADEQGVPYFNRYQEAMRKLDGFKDVDLELYSRAKDLDLDQVEQALDFHSKVHSDPAKLAKVLELLEGKAAAAAEAGKGSESPEVKALKEEIGQIRQYIQGSNQAAWMKSYDDSVENAISESLKDEAMKDLGGKLTDFEKKAVAKLVDDAFQADAAKGKFSKLSLKDVPNVVQGVLKMIQENRKGILGGMVKKDQSPQAMGGSGKTGDPKPKPMSEEERIDAMSRYMSEQEAARVPTA